MAADKAHAVATGALLGMVLVLSWALATQPQRGPPLRERHGVPDAPARSLLRLGGWHEFSEQQAALSQVTLAELNRAQQAQRAHFYLKTDSLQRGVAYRGTDPRTYRLAAKIIRGQPLTVVSLGGSVTAGGWDSYSKFLEGWLNSTYALSPVQRHRVINWGRPGTTSTLYSMCINSMLPPNTDLVVVEFAVNDPPVVSAGAGKPPFDTPERRSFEKLLRSLLNHPAKPAVFVLMSYKWQQTGPFTPAPTSPYYLSAENDLHIISQYYNLPILSLRAAVYHLMVTQQPGYRVDVDALTQNLTKRTDIPQGDAFYLDGLHPNTHGSRCLSDLISYRVQLAIEDYRRAEGESQAWEIGALLPPMMEGNYEMAAMQCVLPYSEQDSLQQLANSSSGFTWGPQRPESETRVKQKWAWSASEPGSELVLSLNSQIMAAQLGQQGPAGGRRTWPGNGAAAAAAASAGAGAAGEPLAQLLLFMIHSWRDAGQAGIDCVAGCQCNATTVDLHWKEASTLAVPVPIKMTQHPDCRVRLTVQPETTSETHRVSLVGLVVGHADAERLVTVGHGQFENGGVPKG